MPATLHQGDAGSAPGAQALRITEIFYSLQGEARTVGRPTVFVRLTGCPLRCVYCDTAYAFSGGEMHSIDAIVAEVASFQPEYVTVLDIKTPASGEMARNDYTNIARLKPQDQVKFVICDRADYAWARFKLDEYQLAERVADVLFSPSFTQLEGRELAEWILSDRLPVRMQLQLHKLLWNDAPGH